MRMKHVLLELYYDDEVNLEKVLDDSTSFEELVANGISFTYANNELAFAGEKGIVKQLEDFISFGGEMDIEEENESSENTREKLLEVWQEVCREKITEAYDEFTERRKTLIDIQHKKNV